MKHQPQLTVELRLVITGCEAVRFLVGLGCCWMLLRYEQSRPLSPSGVENCWT